MHAQPCQQPIIESVRHALHRYDAELKDINLKVWLSVQDRWLHRSPTQIWSDPELAYEEHRAHANICALFDTLSAHGYQVRRKVYGVDTAFEIEYSHGTGGRVVAFNAEYDALPGIGHACGHNLIATSSIAAFIATCEAMKAQFPDGPAYRVRLLGTPAEESGGGKVRMLDAGAYKDVDACLMVHPMPKSANNPELLSMATVLPGGFLANDKVRVTLTGKPAHAAAAPWEGVNALDAVVSAYVNISVLRQQILPSQRVHGVIVQGGDRPNIIPQSATVDYYIRSEDAKSLKPLTDRVVKCFEAAAIATGCEVEFNWGVSYMDLKTNTPICNSYVSAMRAMGHSTEFDNTGQVNTLSGGSTDMGNISYAVPGFHGIFAIEADGVNHTPQFTGGAGSVDSYQRSLACAAGMAIVACQVLTDDAFAEAVKRDFSRD